MGLQSLIASLTGDSVTILIIAMTLLQIAPIEINPWSYLARKIGGAINGDVIEKVDKIGADLEALRNSCDEREAIQCRMRILRFNDEILHGTKHTKEHFEQVFADIGAYKIYCKDHEEFHNNIADDAMNRIRRIYTKCADDGTFL